MPVSARDPVSAPVAVAVSGESRNPVLAADLGATKTALGLVEDSGTVRHYRKLASSGEWEHTVAQIVESADGAQAVGVIVPGIYDPDAGTAWCPNLWGDRDVPLRDALRSRVDIPVIIDSDRTGYVLGESWLGIARGLQNVVFVALGTGIGAGILSQGRIIRGAHGIAGAVGWMALTPGWKDEYAVRGCWEAEGTGPAAAAMFGVARAETMLAAARSGDREALTALHHVARFAEIGVANLISTLNPEMVVLGGGFAAAAGDLLLPLLRSGVLRYAQPIAARHCRIELTTLGDHAGLLGAARLAHLHLRETCRDATGSTRAGSTNSSS